GGPPGRTPRRKRSRPGCGSRSWRHPPAGRCGRCASRSWTSTAPRSSRPGSATGCCGARPAPTPRPRAARDRTKRSAAARSTIPPSNVELLAELERRLDRVRAARPELTGAIELQGALVRARIEMLEPELPPLRVPPGRALEQLRNGTPLLHQTPAFVDISWSAGLFGRLLEVALDHQPEAQAALEALESTLDDGLLDVESLFQEAFVQHRQH